MTTQRESSHQGSAAADQRGTQTGAVPAQQGTPAGTLPPGQQQPYGPTSYPTDAGPAYGAGPGGTYQGGRDPRLAEPWRRLVGWIIDGLIMTVIGAVIWIPALVAMASRVNNYLNLYPNTGTAAAHSAAGHLATQILVTGGLALVAVVILETLYYWLLTGLWGTTVGKWAVGTWVVSSATWAKPGMGAAFLRALVFVVGPAIIGLFFLVDNLWLLWDHDRQCLHDKAASTLVVKAKAIGR
jgi:uncharacterized RDD family membrane protein YckC